MLGRRTGSVAALVVALAFPVVACDSGPPDDGSPPRDRDTSPSSDAIPELRSVTVALAGDVLVHTGVWETAERDAAARGRRAPDFGPMFAGVRPLVEPADLAICHLETPVSPPGGPYLNYPLFSAPPTVLDGLVETGFDACTTASNHAVDQGFSGLARTLRALDRRGLEHTGTYAERRGAGSPLEVDVDGIRIGLVSMTYGTNGMPVTEPWSVNLIDVPRALAQARRMRADGVDVVMVAIHAGGEYSHAPSAEQVQVFDRLTRSPDIDFVYGHHAHVVQPFDRVNGKWVLYGLGNFVAEQLTSIPNTYRGIVGEVTIRELPDGTFRVARPRYAPTLILDPKVFGETRVLDVDHVLNDPGTPPAHRRLARAAAEATDAVMARRGVRRLEAD